MQRFRARKVVEPPKGDFPMEPLTLMETSLCDKEMGGGTARHRGVEWKINYSDLDMVNIYIYIYMYIYIYGE